MLRYCFLARNPAFFRFWPLISCAIKKIIKPFTKQMGSVFPTLANSGFSTCYPTPRPHCPGFLTSPDVTVSYREYSTLLWYCLLVVLYKVGVTFVFTLWPEVRGCIKV